MVELRHRFLRWNEIREQAEKFRRNYVLPLDRIPVPIIDIVELELIIFSLNFVLGKLLSTTLQY